MEIKNEILEDLKNYFNDFLIKNDPKILNVIWQNLYHAKESDLFKNEFYIYWLIKCINIPNEQGNYILCIQSITKKICGFDEKQLGEFLMPRIDFILTLNDLSKTISIINFTLQGGAFFEKTWLMNILDEIGLEDKSDLLKRNAQNEVFFLNNTL